VRVGIIGSGHIGATAARLFVDAGHEVAIANSRGPESLAALVDELGERARAATVEDAESFGELVLVAIPFGRYTELPAEPLRDTIVVDAMNYYPERDGSFPDLDAGRTTSTELLGAHLPGARLVKAFNTMYWKTMGERGTREAEGDRLALFIAGDDADAKQTVAALIEEIGLTPVDTGGLAEGGRRQQPGSPIYNKPMTAREAERALGR
jgi:8-hydroxy-5-deazaflavin:NADPH oxidoreductase